MPPFLSLWFCPCERIGRKKVFNIIYIKICRMLDPPINPDRRLEMKSHGEYITVVPHTNCVTNFLCLSVCLSVCLYLFITAQSRPVITVILRTPFALVLVLPKGIKGSMCVCVCVFIKLHITAQSGLVILVSVCVCLKKIRIVIPFILSGRQVCGRTSRGHTGGRSHRRKVTQDFSTFLLFCGACLNFSREKDSCVPFPRRT